jgi:flagellar hook assembly protein FlgD
VDGGYETSMGIHSAQADVTPPAYSLTTYPNPFVKKTVIDFAIRTQENVSITVYDVSGKMVKSLVAQKLAPGCHEIHWNGEDRMGRRVSNGIYFIKLKTPSYAAEKKVILLR